MDAICKEENFFQNPNKLPLDKLFLQYPLITRTSTPEITLSKLITQIEKCRATSLSKNTRDWSNVYHIKTQKRSALDKCWLDESRAFPHYYSYYLQFDQTQNDDFLTQNEKFAKELSYWAECTTFHQLWCAVAFEPRFASVIVDFLKHAVPPYEVHFLSKPCQKVFERIYSFVYKIYLRLLIFNVSETQFISEEVARAYLRNSELINVRSIYLVSFLYNSKDPRFIQKLVKFYFCDNYKNLYLKELTQLFIDVIEDLDKIGSGLHCETFKNLQFGIRKKPDRYDLSWLDDMSSYALELASSLNTFLEVCPYAIEAAFELELPSRIPHVYKKMYSDIYDMLVIKHSVDLSRNELLLRRWLPLGRSEFLNLFHKFINHLQERILKAKYNAEEQQQLHLEMYIELISVSLDDDVFVKDYNRTYPIEEQLKRLILEVPAFDPTQADYLLSSLSEILGKVKKKKRLWSTNNVHSVEHRLVKQTSNFWDEYEAIYDTLTQFLQIRASIPTSRGPSTSDAVNTKSRNLPEPVIVALKQYVHLKRHLKNDFRDDVIDSISVDNLNKPDEDEIEKRIKNVQEMLPDLESFFVLKCLERMEYKPERVISCVLDGNVPTDLRTMSDNLDQFTRDANKCRQEEKSKERTIVHAYFGKQPTYADARDMLNERNADIKNLVLQASNNYDLDDDYDDRNEIPFYYRDGPKIEQIDVSEYDAVSEASENSTSEDDAVKEPSQNGGAFCEDPAVVRARREAQRRHKYGEIQHRKHNVVGKSKGQGQDASTKHNRNVKNTQKKSRANHNRKGEAHWKQNKGMLPS